MNEIITTQGIEFIKSELMTLAMDNQYVVKYNTVYLAVYTKNAGARLEKVYRSRGDLPLTKRGRYHTMDYKRVNKLLGFELLIG